ncbi:MAG TPA: hypothetical protein VKT30_15490 [Caulobacteraceae bacterium]|nr:hypothetical protein [Caulobacteraceae bacterium]
MSTFQIVNGYVCFNCSDVALAQKGINPAHPPNSPDPAPPSATGQTGGPQGPTNTQSTPAVTFGGALSQLNGAAAVQAPGSAAASAPAGQQPPGQTSGQLNILA